MAIIQSIKKAREIFSEGTMTPQDLYDLEFLICTDIEKAVDRELALNGKFISKDGEWSCKKHNMYGSPGTNPFACCLREEKT